MDGAALERIAACDHIVFDKTGTLTDGQLRVVNSRGLGGVGAATMLAYAAAIEEGSNHPVAKAISKPPMMNEANTASTVTSALGLKICLINLFMR